MRSGLLVLLWMSLGISVAQAKPDLLDLADESMQRGDWNGVSLALSEYTGARDARFLALAGRLALQQQRYAAAANNFESAMRQALPADRGSLRAYRTHARRCADAHPLTPELIDQIETRKRVRPVAPLEAAASGIDGVVVVSAMVNQKGRIDSAQILTAYPPRVFDDAVLLALQKWRYRPLNVDGQSVPFCVQLPFSFRFAN